MKLLNLQLKDGIEPKELLKYGFIPKFDTDTGEITEYYLRFWVDNREKRHFTFFLHKDVRRKWLRRLSYEGWMTGCNWNEVATPECMKILYQLFVDGIVEPAEKVVKDNDR